MPITPDDYDDTVVQLPNPKTGLYGTECNKTFTVTVDTRLRIRTGPSTSFAIVGYRSNGEIFHAIREYNGWYYDNRGWSAMFDANTQCLKGENNSVVEVPKESIQPDNNQDETMENSDNTIQDEKDSYNVMTLSEDELKTYLPNILNYSNVDSEIASRLMTQDMSGVLGMPYQFMPSVDRRLQWGNKKSEFGHRYAEKIASRMPVLFITPGEVDFMKGFDKNTKKSVLKVLIGDDSDPDEVLEAILSGKCGKYYTFKYKYNDFFKFVNPQLRTLANLMGIGETHISIGSESAQLKYFDWSKTLNNDFKQYFSAAEAIPFYLDSETSINEEFSNSTTESALASKINDIGPMARELNYILGVSSGTKINAMQSSSFDNIQSEIDSLIDSTFGGSNLLKGLANNFHTVATGGKLIFPEIWNDSEFSKTYTIRQKLRSPDCDPLSIYLNICVPSVFWICLTAPHQMGINGFTSPYLVRGWYKGLFNIDMGMITGLSFSKGKEGSWSAMGIPTEVDVDVTIKDLYSAFFITGVDTITSDLFGKNIDSSGVKNFVNNTSLMDYLCNMAGVNIGKPEITRMAQIWTLLYQNKFGDVPNDIWLKVEQIFTNTTASAAKFFNIR